MEQQLLLFNKFMWLNSLYYTVYVAKLIRLRLYNNMYTVKEKIMKNKRKPFTAAEVRAINKRKLQQKEYYSCRSIFGHT